MVARATWIAALVLLGASAAGAAEAGGAMVYRGMCDASAAVALGPAHFIVADDEHNVLRVYRRDAAEPVDAVDLAKFLRTADDKESDLEGSAELDGLVYWIGSHGRNRNGKERPERHRLFAMEPVPGADPPTLRPVGKAYERLLDDLLDAPTLARYDLGRAAKRAAEAPGGFNIEGLAASPGGGLWIGLRNPIPHGRALIVPIANPREVAMGAARARIGAPIELDLGGRGIRSLERVAGAYLVVAGPPADDGDFALYRWSGSAGDAPRRIDIALGTLRPEALYAIPGTRQVQLLSDDGGIETGGTACKDLPAARRSFAGSWSRLDRGSRSARRATRKCE